MKLQRHVTHRSRPAQGWAALARGAASALRGGRPDVFAGAQPIGLIVTMNPLVPGRGSA